MGGEGCSEGWGSLFSSTPMRRVSSPPPQLRQDPETRKVDPSFSRGDVLPKLEQPAADHPFQPPTTLLVDGLRLVEVEDK